MGGKVWSDGGPCVIVVGASYFTEADSGNGRGWEDGEMAKMGHDLWGDGSRIVMSAMT